MLEILVQRHDEWVAMAIANGCPAHLAEDVVQEAYIRLHKYSPTVYHKIILPDNEVNTFYMFSVVRNTFRTLAKHESFYSNWEDFYNWADEESDFEYEEAYQKIMDKIQIESDSWGSYHSKLFNVYFKTDFSMRDISSGTGIGVTHIHQNINKYKEIILDKFEEDFEDLKNGDYDKI
jgi:DNA-directed RNA polymerase specialized sigma24 family protein